MSPRGTVVAMGEQADYMLNGDDCQICGVPIGEGDGYPRTCAGCDDGPSVQIPHYAAAIAGAAEKDGYMVQDGVRLPPIGKHVACPDPTNGCERKFINRHAAAMHWIDKHG